jgi:multiple sugar transport system permease protein
MKKYLNKIIFYLLILIITFICLFPAYVIIVSSLQGEREVLSIPAKFIPKPIRLDNYVKVWSTTPLANYIKNGLIVNFGTIFVTLIISSLAAYPLALLRLPGKSLIMTGLLFTQMFAPAVVLLPLFKLFQQLNLLNSFLGLIIVNSTFSLAFSTLLIASFFETVPYEVLDAAAVDGCSKLGTLIKILLPITSSGILVVSIYIFTLVWNEFLFAFTFISSYDKYTPIVGLFNLIQVPGDKLPPWHLVMTTSSILSLPALLLFFIQRNSLSKGLTSGAIK